MRCRRVDARALEACCRCRDVEEFAARGLEAGSRRSNMQVRRSRGALQACCLFASRALETRCRAPRRESMEVWRSEGALQACRRGGVELWRHGALETWSSGCSMLRSRGVALWRVWRRSNGRYVLRSGGLEERCRRGDMKVWRPVALETRCRCSNMKV